MHKHIKKSTGARWVKLWFEKGREIVLFKKQKNKWPDVSSHDRQELSLGLWKKKLRKYYNKGKLPENLVQYLRENDFYFDAREGWKIKFLKLENFVKEHGNLPPGNHPLARWVSSLYYFYDLLSSEKKKALKSISFLTLKSASGKIDMSWDERLSQVRDFYKEYGKLPSRKDNMKLANWVAVQRLKLKEGRMPKAEIRRLKEAGIDLLAGTFSTQSWEEVFEEMKKFVDKKKMLPEYSSKDPKEKKLYTWLQLQKVKYRKGKLPDVRFRQFLEQNNKSI